MKFSISMIVFALALTTGVFAQGHGPGNTKIDCKINETRDNFSFEYLGGSALEIRQGLVEGINQLHLMALSQSVETIIGNKVKKYAELEDFAVSFQATNQNAGTTLRLKIFEDKKFEIYVESFPFSKTIVAYEGKCNKRISKDLAKQFISDIEYANKDLNL